MPARPSTIALLVIAVLLMLLGPASRAAPASAAAPGWMQVNSSGFGDPGNNTVASLASFGGRLYAGAHNPAGAQLWRLDPAGWTRLASGGFGDPTNTGINHLIAFDGYLYAGTMNEVSTPALTTGAQVWRSADGTSWGRVTLPGLDPTNGEISRFAIYNTALFAGTFSYDEARGGEVWRSTTGASGTWSRVASNGFGDAHSPGIMSFEVHGGWLYAGTMNWTTGGQVWRCSGNCTSWSKVSPNGFGDVGNIAVSALAVFNGRLYASTVHSAGAGAQVWCCQTCNGGDWQRVVTNGFGDSQTRGMSSLEVFAGQLYLTVGNAQTGMQVWRTASGTQWEQVGRVGFGDPANRAPYWDSGVAVFENRLYVGTWNPASGGQLWLYLPHGLHLPLALRLR